MQVYGDGVEGEPENPDGMALSEIARMKEELALDPGENEQAKALRNFVTAITVCHTVVCERTPDKGEVQYSSSSPDELALVMGARGLGARLLSRSRDEMRI